MAAWGGVTCLGSRKSHWGSVKSAQNTSGRCAQKQHLTVQYTRNYTSKYTHKYTYKDTNKYTHKYTY